MKKKIVITALTAMLAVSMVTPVYADDLPPIKWDVDIEQYYGYSLEGSSIPYKEWAAQYQDELLAIQDESARYDRIFQIVTDYLSIKGAGTQYVSFDEFSRGLGHCGNYTGCIDALCQIAGIESTTVSGFNGPGDNTIYHLWNLVKINGEYFYSDAMRTDNMVDHGYESEYEYCKKTKELWPTFTISNTNAERWTADEYLTKLQQLYDADKPDPSVMVDPSTIDWDNPYTNEGIVHFMGGRRVD